MSEKMTVETKQKTGIKNTKGEFIEQKRKILNSVHNGCRPDRCVRIHSIQTYNTESPTNGHQTPTQQTNNLPPKKNLSTTESNNE